MTEQEPLAAQHDPVGWAHCAPVQVLATPRNVPTHCSCTTLAVHVPSRLQHAPSDAGGHGFVGVHARFTVHDDTPWQLGSCETEHAPLLSTQQAPRTGCGQGLGVHMPPVNH